jgi:exopolysaccharide biosynthesis polyprenyl glycosylphosphotransferase
MGVVGDTRQRVRGRRRFRPSGDGDDLGARGRAYKDDIAVDGLGVPLEARSVVAPHYPARDSAIRRTLAVTDFAVVSFAVAIALEVARHPLAWLPAYLPLAFVFVVLFKCYGLYDRHVRRIAHSGIDELPRLFHAVLVGSLLAWALSWPFGNGRLWAAPVAVLGALTFILVPLMRRVARSFVVSRLGPERALLVGDDAELDLLVRKIKAHPEYQLEPVGFLSHSAPAAHAGGLPVMGDAGDADVGAIVRDHDIGRVLLSRRGLDREAVVGLIRTCNEHRVKVSYLPQVFEGLGPSTEVDDIEGVTLLGLNPPVMTRSSRALKRGMDVCGATFLLVAAWPLCALIALAVKLDTRGPVFFRQSRIGRSGRRFNVIKFRTMVVDAEQQAAALRAQSLDPDWLLLERDPRVTRVGRFLRHSSLDELPQLINVLRGEMSLVGPRPIIESEDRQLEGWRRSRVDLTPGLTGMWQVLGRNSIPFEEMIKLDYLYVTNWSLWTDIRLVLRTVPAVFARRGVN